MQSSITQRVQNLPEKLSSYSVLILDRITFSPFSMDPVSTAKINGDFQNNLIYMTGHRF